MWASDSWDNGTELLRLFRAWTAGFCPLRPEIDRSEGAIEYTNRIDSRSWVQILVMTNVLHRAQLLWHHGSCRDHYLPRSFVFLVCGPWYNFSRLIGVHVIFDFVIYAINCVGTKMNQHFWRIFCKPANLCGMWRAVVVKGGKVCIYFLAQRKRNKTSYSLAPQITDPISIPVPGDMCIIAI